jgi:hypothetical protein
METLTDAEANLIKRRIRNSPHDWDLILDGKNNLLTQGIDFHCDVKSFRNRCYSYAHSKHLKCHTHLGVDNRGRETLLVIAYNPGD